MIDLDDGGMARALNLLDFIEADLRSPKDSILVEQITTAREVAIIAARALIDTDPHDWKQIQSLQNDVKRFSFLVTWLRNAQYVGKEHFSLLPPDEQAAVLKFTNPHIEIVNDA